MIRGLAVLAVVSLVGTAAPAQDQEEKIPLDKVPKVVLDPVKKRFPRAEVVGVVKELTDDKKPVFEVELKESGKTIDVSISPEGSIVLIEKEIDPRELPKAVTAAVEAKYPKATYKIAEELIPVKDGKETLDAYEVLIETADKKARWELKLDRDGKILKTEDKTRSKD